MPVGRRKRAPPGTETPTAKRRRTATGSAAKRKTPAGSSREPKEEDDLEFAEAKVDDEDVIDLADTEEMPEELLVPKKDNRVKLAAFQCVICMDDSTGLTLTHCGMLLLSVLSLALVHLRVCTLLALVNAC